MEEGEEVASPASKLLLSAFTLISFSPTILRRLPSSVPLGLSPLPGAGGSQPEAAAALAANRARLRIFARGRYRGQQVSVGLKGVEGMEIPNPVSMFEARHGDNTDVLLALLTQNKELEGKAKLKTLKLEWSGQSPVDIAVIINAVPRSF